MTPIQFNPYKLFGEFLKRTLSEEFDVSYKQEEIEETHDILTSAIYPKHMINNGIPEKLTGFILFLFLLFKKMKRPFFGLDLLAVIYLETLNDPLSKNALFLTASSEEYNLEFKEFSDKVSEEKSKLFSD